MKNKFEEVACCKAMYTELIDKEVNYDEVLNRFFYTGKRVFAYCPNCGTKLPDYSEEFADTLEEVLGKDFCDIKEEEIPQEFKSDKWWKHRKIKGIGRIWNYYDPVKTGNY